MSEGELKKYVKMHGGIKWSCSRCEHVMLGKDNLISYGH